MIPPALARLSEDDLYAVLMLAAEIVTTPQPIEGLTRQQSHIVHVLRGAGGRFVSDEAMTDVVATNAANPPNTASIRQQYMHIRRHSVGQRIERRGGGKAGRGMARWRV